MERSIDKRMEIQNFCAFWLDSASEESCEGSDSFTVSVSRD